jgi:hypothetical protein
MIWVFGWACKLGAMLEAKKRIVLTSGRLDSRFAKKYFLVRPKEN